MSEKAEGQFMGVCATMANKLDIDVFFIRVAVAILAIVSGGFFILLYLILGMFASEE